MSIRASTTADPIFIRLIRDVETLSGQFTAGTVLHVLHFTAHTPGQGSRGISMLPADACEVVPDFEYPPTSPQMQKPQQPTNPLADLDL